VSATNLAIIGGSGVYDQTILDNEREITVDTKYGGVLMTEGSYKGRKVFFMARHGGEHSVPPHKVNYRANIAALKKLDVDTVIATAAVGSINQIMPPGCRVVIDQFIDFTSQRALTFYDGENGPVAHVDFTEPYCPEIRAAILKAGRDLSQELIDGGCYVCTDGPRFETPAEIKMFKHWGGDLVGMTNVPEVVLAREAGLCYATIALSTNFAAGISETVLTHEEVMEQMNSFKLELEQLFAGSIQNIRPERSCQCKVGGENWPGE